MRKPIWEIKQEKRDLLVKIIAAIGKMEGVERQDALKICSFNYMTNNQWMVFDDLCYVQPGGGTAYQGGSRGSVGESVMIENGIEIVTIEFKDGPYPGVRMLPITELHDKGWPLPDEIPVNATGRYVKYAQSNIATAPDHPNVSRGARYKWKETNMSIDAIVSNVERQTNGNGKLELSGPNAGQPALHFDASPHDVSLLKDQQIWGSADTIMLGETEIAKRDGYTQITFVVGCIADAIKTNDKIKAMRDKAYQEGFDAGYKKRKEETENPKKAR